MASEPNTRSIVSSGGKKDAVAPTVLYSTVGEARESRADNPLAKNGIGLFEISSEGKITFANAEGARLLDRQITELIGQPLEALGVIIQDSRGRFESRLVSAEQIPTGAIAILGVLAGKEETLLEVQRERRGQGREDLMIRDASDLAMLARRSQLRTALRSALQSHQLTSSSLAQLIQVLLREFSADHAWIWESTESGHMLIPQPRVEAMGTRYSLPAFGYGEIFHRALALAEPVMYAADGIEKFRTTPPNAPGAGFSHEYLGAMLRLSSSRTAVLMLERGAENRPWQTTHLELLRENVDLISLSFNSLCLREKADEGATYLRNVLESTDIGILVLNRTLSGYRVSLLNERFCALFRVTKEEFEQTNEEGILEFLGSQLGNKQLILDLLENPEREHTGESVTVGETPRVLQVFSRVATDSSGHPFGRLFLFRDITRDKELEQQLLHSQKMESIGTLAGGIAHDFNNLLTTMLGFSELLKRDISAESPLYERVDQIERSARRAADLTRNLLAFSRRAPTQMQVLDVKNFISKTMSILRFSVPSSVEIRLLLEEDLPLVEGDETQLEQVLINLVINAKDALPDEKGVITIVARRGRDIQKTQRSAPGDFVVLEVDDNGVGISQQDLGRIFEPFYTTKGVGRGTGLGLSMVYGIVKQHHGFIEVASAPSLGSTFSVYLPATSKKPPAAVNPKIAPSVKPKEKTRARILVVDDEADLLDFCVMSLKETCDAVLTASDGIEAIKVIEAEGDSIDLVILDLTMPHMGGVETFRRIRKRHPKLRIVITSGYSLGAGVSELLREGAALFLQKPYTIEDLQRVVDQSLS